MLCGCAVRTEMHVLFQCPAWHHSPPLNLIKLLCMKGTGDVCGCRICCCDQHAMQTWPVCIKLDDGVLDSVCITWWKVVAKSASCDCLLTGPCLAVIR